MTKSCKRVLTALSPGVGKASRMCMLWTSLSWGPLIGVSHRVSRIGVLSMGVPSIARFSWGCLS